MDQGVLLHLPRGPWSPSPATTAPRASLLTVAGTSLALDYIGSFLCVDTAARLLCASTKIHKALCRSEWYDWYLTVTLPPSVGVSPPSSPKHGRVECGGMGDDGASLCHPAQAMRQGRLQEECRAGRLQPSAHAVASPPGESARIRRQARADRHCRLPSGLPEGMVGSLLRQYGISVMRRLGKLEAEHMMLSANFGTLEPLLNPLPPAGRNWRLARTRRGCLGCVPAPLRCLGS